MYRRQRKADYSRKQLDELQEFVKRYGAGALAWIKFGDETTSSLLKVLGASKIEQLAAKAEKGDLVLIVAGRRSVVAASLGALRNEIARREDLIDRSKYACLIVTEFPMFEHDEETDTYVAAHHPFTERQHFWLLHAEANHHRDVVLQDSDIINDVEHVKWRHRPGFPIGQYILQ